MNEKIKKRNNNSSNNSSIINTSLMKADKESGNPVKKIWTVLKRDKSTDTRDNIVKEFLIEQNKKKIGIKRVWSSYNIFFYNKDKTFKYTNIPFFKKNNIYSGSSIFSAPSVKQNRLEINKLLKNYKIRRLNYINNIHHSMMIKESKLYRKKINYFSKDNSFDNILKNNLKKKYNINDMNNINKKENIVNKENKDNKENIDNKEKIEKKEILNIVKSPLQKDIKGLLFNKRNKRTFSNYELSLKRYKELKQSN